MEEDIGVRVTRSRRRMSVEQDSKPIETTPAPATPTTAKANRRMSMEREVKIPEDNASATPTKRKPGRMSIKPELPNVIENIVLGTPSKKSPELPARGRMSILPTEVILEDVVESEPTSKRTRGKKATGATEDEASDAGVQIGTPTKRVTRNLAATVNSPRTRRISRRISVTGNDKEVENPVVTPLKRNRTVSYTVISPSNQIGKVNFSPIKTPAKVDSTINENTPNSNVTLVMRDDSISPIRKSPRLKNSPKGMCCASNTTSPKKTLKLVEASPTKAQRKSLSASLEVESKIGKCESPIDVFAPKGDIGDLEPPQPMDIDDSFQFNDTSFGSSGLVLDSVSAPEKSQSQGKEISINIKNDDNTSFKVSFTSSATSIDILSTGNAANKSDTDTSDTLGMITKKMSRNSSLNESGNKSKTPTKKVSSMKDSDAVTNLDTTADSVIKKNKRNSVNESKNEPKTTIKISQQLEKSDTDLNSTTDSITTKTQKKRNSIIDDSKTPITNSQEMEQLGNQSIKNAQEIENSSVTNVDKNAELQTTTSTAEEVEQSDMSDTDFDKATKNKRKSLSKSANQSIKNAPEIENSTDTDIDKNAESATPKTKKTFQNYQSIDKTITPARIAQEMGKSDMSDADFDTPTGDSKSTKNKRKSSNNTKTPIKNAQDNGRSDAELLKLERNFESGHKTKTPVKNPSDADIESPAEDSILTKNKRKSLNNTNTPIKNAQDYGQSDAELLKKERNSESGHKTKTPVKNPSDVDIESSTGEAISTKNKRKSLNNAKTPIKNTQDNEQSDAELLKMERNSESGHKTKTPVKNPSDADIESLTGDSISTKSKRKSLNNTNTPIKNSQDYGPSDAELLKMERNSESGHKTRTPVKNASDADIKTPTGDSLSTKNKRISLSNAKTPIRNAQNNGQSDPESFKMKRNSESDHKTAVKNAQESELSNNRNSSLNESIAKAKASTGNSGKKTKMSDAASEPDSASDPGKSTRKTPNESLDDSAEFSLLILSETGNTSSERLISSTNSDDLNLSKTKTKSIMLNANSDDDFIKISNKSNSQISSTEEGGSVKKRMTSAKLFSSEKLSSKSLPINNRKNNILKQNVSYGDNPKHSLKLFKNTIATSTPNVNKAGNNASEPTNTSETVCIDSESEKSENDDTLIDDECEDAGDDYESGDSMSESERDLIELNEIPELGETLDSASSISSDNSASNDSFFVSSDEMDEELLSGTGDDLSSGDDELTFSAKSKEKFNKKAVKTQKNASREMYRSRHAADESDDEVVIKPKLSKSKNNILSDAEENDAASGNSQDITVIDNTKKPKEEDELSSLSEGNDIKAITNDYNKILKDLKTEHISKLDNDSKKTVLKNDSIMSDFGLDLLYDNESVNASQSKTNEIKRSSKRKANYSINSNFGINALHATEIEKLDTSETKKTKKASPCKQGGLSPLKNTMLKDTHKAVNTSKESISKKRKRNEVVEKHDSLFIAPLAESILKQLTDASEQPKKKKTKVSAGFTVEDIQGGECELDMTIIDEEPPTFTGSSGDFKVVKKAKVKVPLGACRPSKLGSTTEFQVTSSCSTTKFKVVTADKHPKTALKANSYLSDDILNFRNERLFGSNVKRMDNKQMNSIKEKLIASGRSYMRN